METLNQYKIFVIYCFAMKPLPTPITYTVVEDIVNTSRFRLNFNKQRLISYLSRI